jgi:hypothetical protein
MSLERAKNLLKSFNSGDYEEDIEPFFNTVINFLNFIKKYGLLDDLSLGELPSREFDEELFQFLVDNGIVTNLDYDTMPEEFKNLYLLHGLTHNYEDTMIFITNNLITDVDVRPDGFYFYVKDREDLSFLFCGSNRDGGARYVAKKILSEDGMGHDWYYDNNVKPYEVVEELDESNITRLKDIIYKEVGDKELSLEDYNSDFFESLSEEQGTDGYFRVKPQDLNDLVKDGNAINELFNNDLEEIGQELRSLYWNSENQAYEGEVYDLVYDGLDDFFEGGFDNVSREVTLRDGNKKTVYHEYLKIRNFPNIIKEFLNGRKMDQYTDSHLEYFGDFINLLVAMINESEVECIDFRVPDYPDWDRTRKNINENFTDYI